MKHKAAGFLLLLGLITMVGDLLGIAALRGFGAATVASPAPKVFSAVKGYETYSTRFLLEWRDRNGREHVLELTPEIYAKLRGPYNRRNVYGAAIAYAPVLSTDELTRDMFWAAARYALTGNAPILREFGVDPATIEGPIRVRFLPLPGTDMGDLPTLIEVDTR